MSSQACSIELLNAFLARTVDLQHQLRYNGAAVRFLHDLSVRAILSFCNGNKGEQKILQDQLITKYKLKLSRENTVVQEFVKKYISPLFPDNFFDVVELTENTMDSREGFVWRVKPNQIFCLKNNEQYFAGEVIPIEKYSVNHRGTEKLQILLRQLKVKGLIGQFKLAVAESIQYLRGAKQMMLQHPGSITKKGVVSKIAKKTVQSTLAGTAKSFVFDTVLHFLQTYLRNIPGFHIVHENLSFDLIFDGIEVLSSWNEHGLSEASKEVGRKIIHHTSSTVSNRISNHVIIPNYLKLPLKLLVYLGGSKAAQWISEKLLGHTKHVESLGYILSTIPNYDERKQLLHIMRNGLDIIYSNNKTMTPSKL